MNKNNIIFLLCSNNTYNTLVYNTLNDCIDASTSFKNEINWEIPKYLHIINHSSSNRNNYTYGPIFYNYSSAYYEGQTDYYLKEEKRVLVNNIAINANSSCMYRPCINIHE